MISIRHSAKYLPLVALLAVSPLSEALELRQFKNTDGTKSFTATLANYNPKSKQVTVNMENGRTKRFSIKLLSQEDQKYVLDSLDELAICRSVSVSFKEVKGETTRRKTDLVRTSTTPTAYQIELYNRSDQIIRDLEVRYSFYYCVGSSSYNGPRHTPKVITGTIFYPKLFGKYHETRKTAEVVLVREVKKGIAPPVPSGGGGG